MIQQGVWPFTIFNFNLLSFYIGSHELRLSLIGEMFHQYLFSSFQKFKRNPFASHYCFTFRLTITVALTSASPFLILINLPHHHHHWSKSRTFDLEEERPFPEDSFRNHLTAAQNRTEFFGSNEGARWGSEAMEMDAKNTHGLSIRPLRLEDVEQMEIWCVDCRGKMMGTRGRTHVSLLVCMYCVSGCQRHMWSLLCLCRCCALQ